jgi:toxin ParE1/3/4
MERLEFSPQAMRELRDIWDYTADKWSESQADKYTGKIKMACQKIAMNPGLGHRYNNMPIALWAYRVERHVIVYAILPDKIEIARILHDRMSFKKQFAINR